MANAIKDSLKIVCEWAEKSTPSGSAAALLNDAIGTNVGKGRLGLKSDKSDFDNSFKALVIQPQAQTSEFDAPVQSDRYVFKCYGGSNNPDDAINVFRLVFNAFHKAFGDTTTGGIVRSELETGSLQMEQDTGYPVYIAVFFIMTT